MSKMGNFYIDVAERVGLDPTDERVLDLIGQALDEGATTVDDIAENVRNIIVEAFYSVKRSIDAAEGDHITLTTLRAQASLVESLMRIARIFRQSIDYGCLIDNADYLAVELERIAPVTYAPTAAGVEAAGR